MPIISGGGGGGGASSAPVGCVLGLAQLDVSAAGNHVMNWDSLTDNTFDGNPLGALPAGIGFTVAFDGSDGFVTFTDNGVWSFTLSFSYGVGDVTWKGSASSQSGGNMLIAMPSGSTAGDAGGSDIVQAAAGDSIGWRVGTANAATGTVNISSVALEIVRLA